MMYLRHKPTGDLYPMNPDLRNHPDMEVWEAPQEEVKAPEPTPAPEPKPKPRRKPKPVKATAPVPDAADDIGDLNLDLPEYEP